MSKKNNPDVFVLRPSEFFQALRVMGATKRKRSAFAWGPPGIAKSAVMQQYADAEGIAFIDIRLSQMDPTDLRGIPFPIMMGGVHGMRWSAPIALPSDLNSDEVREIAETETVIPFINPKGSNDIHYCTDPDIQVKSLTKGTTAKIIARELDNFTVALVDGTGEIVAGKIHWRVRGKVKAVVALEEFNSAPQTVQAAAYQLIHDRRLGEYVVPEAVIIVGAGNRETDKGITYKMATPVANRFTHIEVKPDFDDWQAWALKERLHKDVVGYLSAFKNDMFQFDPSTASRGFPTPRSWHAVSDILYAGDDMPDNIALALIAGGVGDGIAGKFFEYRKHASELPKTKDILSGSLKKFTRKPEVSLCYALTTALCYELAEKAEKVRSIQKTGKQTPPERVEWLKEADNFLEFMMENFVPEICIMGAKTAIAIHRLPFDTQRMKHFDTFANLYKDYIMA